MSHEKQIDDLHEALASTESELRDAREALARVGTELDSILAKAPTQWAYDRACAALHRHRERANKAEALLQEALARTPGWSERAEFLLNFHAEQQEAPGAQPGEFKREQRYMVIKLSKLADDQGRNMSRREEIFRIAHFGRAMVDCVVVESDWPEYEPTWAAIQARVEGGE